MLFKKKKRRFIFTAALLVALGVFVYYQNNHIEVSEFEFLNDRVGNLEIVQLSDLHGKQFGRGNEKLAQAVLAQNPDLVVVTGDTIDHPTRNLYETVGFLGNLSESVPVICISGNHERQLSTRDEFFQMLRDAGVIVLENEIYTISFDGSTVNILGLDERQWGTEDVMRQRLQQLEVMPGLRIVLSHYPQRYSLVESLSYSAYDFDLMFAGHAHGGQWNLPIIGGVYSPGQGLMPEYYRGLYDGRLLVSAGLGNAQFPVRLFNYPQIIVAQIN
jgi:predicted MPP superfamily phosphohydrolase